MGGRLPLRAEVVAGFDDAGSEDFLPEAVHDDPRAERVRVVHQPLSQAQPIARERSRHRGKCGGSVGFDEVLRPIIHAAIENVGLGIAIRYFLHHVRDAASAPNLSLLQGDLPFLLDESAVVVILEAYIVEPQGLPLVWRKLTGVLLPHSLQDRQRETIRASSTVMTRLKIRKSAIPPPAK